MPEAVSRLQFLRGDFRNGRAPMRPPWALDEATFTEVCTRCEDCRNACPEGIVGKGRGGFPTVSFERGECTFCGDCVKVCKSKALARVNGNGAERAPWSITAEISSSCLSMRGITCRVCGDRCDARAIRFQLAVGGVANPRIDLAACNGCGACVSPCPVGAVEVS